MKTLFTRKNGKIEKIYLETSTDDYGSWAQYWYDSNKKQIQEPTYGTYYDSIEMLERMEKYHEKRRKALDKIKP